VSFPIDRASYRDYPADWSGPVFICDIDRTYLATRLSSYKGMMRVPFEAAVDKIAIDGMRTLLREIRRGPCDRSRHTPLYFVSASPAQLRPVIERKMLFDGLEFDGTTFKDWLGVVRSGRLGRFREQVGFKLTALLIGRRELPAGAEEILIGDDHESDALTFTLYADLLAGRLVGERLFRALRRQRVLQRDAEAIVALREEIGQCAGVRRAYVRLERYREADFFFAFAPRLAACRGALQMALSLWAGGEISLDGVLRVARELAERRYGPSELGRQLEDASRRGLVERKQAREAAEGLVGAGLIEGGTLPAVDPRWRLQFDRSRGLWTPDRYLP
jgi:hypothetical protein